MTNSSRWPWHLLKAKMQFPQKLLLLLLTVLSSVVSQEDEEYESIAVELHLADYDLSDAYDEISEVTKEILLGNQGYGEKIQIEQGRGRLVRIQSEKNFQIEGDVPYDLERNWTLLTKAGDLLLPETDLNSLIAFHNTNEELSNQAKVSCLQSDLIDCTIKKEEVENILATNRNASQLNKTWSEWQEIFAPNRANFNATLHVANNAFIPNEEHSVRSYWEMLSEYEDGYEKAQTLWKEVQPLYTKLHDFVKVRVYNYYNITSHESSIPVYLLGTNFANDWNKIADIVVPHPYLYDEVQTELKYQTVRDIFILAENSTKTMHLGSLGKKFWTKSNFNFSSCGPHIFSHCGSSFTEVLTCNMLGWSEYLNIHETAVNVALRNQDYSSLPRRGARFSAVDEALQNLGSIIAINNLPTYEFIPKNAFRQEPDTYDYKNSALLLTALKFLPKLPYYLLADIWRLEELEFSYGNFTENWWEKRDNIQGVHGYSNMEADFLGDPFITSNKPHLSQFLGIFLQFQIIDYYKKFFSTENGTLVNFISNDENFLAFIQDRPNKNWKDLMSFHYGIDEISSSALLEYFNPLIEYLEKAPLTPVTFSTTAKPRTTKSTAKPSSKRTRGPKRVKVATENTTPTIQNDEGHKQQPKILTIKEPTKAVDAENVTSSSSSNLGVFIGIIGVVIVVIVLISVVKRLKRKPRTNNRRFET